MMWRSWLWLAGALALALAVPSAAARLYGQTVEFRRGSRGMSRADAALIEVLRRAEYRVIARDTIIGREEVVVADIVVVGSSLRVEGRMEGDLVGVQSDIFARPGSRFEGTVAVLAGGFYGSRLAWLRRPVIDASLYDYRIVGADAGEYVVAGPGGRNVLRLPGAYGLLAPQYDRVSALNLRWGVDVEGGGADWIPDASARIGLRTAPTDLDAELQLRWPVSRHSLGLRGGRTVRSNDRWANGDIANSLYAVMGARDTRLYYEARFVQADLRLNFGRFIAWTQDIVVSWERARSLVNRDPFSIFSFRGGFQPNPPVSEADAVSVRTKAFIDSQEPEGRRFQVEAGIERADRSLAGDLSFTVVRAAGHI